MGPSAGGTSNYDYEIYGDLTGTDGDYRIELSLVTGKTRELVARGSSRFARPEEAGQSGGFAALNLSATDKGSVPLRDVVHKFELRKREESPKVALGARLSFAKYETRMRIDAEQEIQVKLIDCDDYKLKGRKIQFKASAGRITSQAVADENGMAK